MAVTTEQHYAAYITGLLAFYSWGAPLHEKQLIDVRKSTVDLSGQVSKRFLLGLTRDSSFPFLGAQEPELSWLGKIPWDMALMARTGAQLTMIAKHANGIPGFAVSLMTETHKKLQALYNFEKLDIRFIEVDRNGRLSDLSKTLASIPIRVVPSSAALDQIVHSEVEAKRSGLQGLRR